MTRHHFKIRVSEHAFRTARFDCQMAAVEPVPPDMEVMAWYEPAASNEHGCYSPAVVYEGSHAGSPESLAIIARLMTVAR